MFLEASHTSFIKERLRILHLGFKTLEMEMYYTKREYNQMKNALANENKRLKKQIEKLQKKVKELEYTKEVVFEPDFEMNPVVEETTE